MKKIKLPPGYGVYEGAPFTDLFLPDAATITEFRADSAGILRACELWREDNATDDWRTDALIDALALWCAARESL